MKRLFLAAIVTMAATAPAWAQSSTGTGVGIAGSTSNSQALSGQGGTGIAAITSNSSVPANQTLKNVPSVFSPGLAAAGLETCLGSVSAGGAFVGTGISFGTTVPDPACAARLDARTLWSMGLKKAAVARLCLNTDIYRAMPDVCQQYMPKPVQPSPYYAEGTYRGGPIMLVDGKTGKERLCNAYDEPGQRCEAWADAAPRVRTKVAAATPTPLPKPRPAVVTADAKPAVGFAELKTEPKKD